MLTWLQLAAALDSLEPPDRLILVGDHRQLPPIGAGRPYVDIVRRHLPENVDRLFPRIGRGYAELTVMRRQAGQDRDEPLLARWFGGTEMPPGADEIWERLRARGVNMPTLRTVHWAQQAPQSVLDSVLSEELSVGAGADGNFETPHRTAVNETVRSSTSATEQAVLVRPVRRGRFSLQFVRAPWGSTEINRHLKLLTPLPGAC